MYKLLKKWDDIETQTKKVLNDFKFLIPILKIEHGYDKHLSQYANIETLENVFGFPYTSSSSFGAIWNTNTQTKIKNMYFRGLAIDENNDTIIILENKNGDSQLFNISKEIYFDWLDIPNKNVYICFKVAHQLNFDLYIPEYADMANIEYATYTKNNIFAYFGQSGGFDWIIETATKHKPNTKTGGGWQVGKTSQDLTKQTEFVKGLLIKAYEQSKDHITSNYEQNIDIKDFYKHNKKIIFTSEAETCKQ